MLTSEDWMLYYFAHTQCKVCGCDLEDGKRLHARCLECLPDDLRVEIERINQAWQLGGAGLLDICQMTGRTPFDAREILRQMNLEGWGVLNDRPLPAIRRRVRDENANAA